VGGTTHEGKDQKKRKMVQNVKDGEKEERDKADYEGSDMPPRKEKSPDSLGKKK